MNSAHHFGLREDRVEGTPLLSHPIDPFPRVTPTRQLKLAIGVRENVGKSAC